MGLFKDESGLVFEADDAKALAMGYEPFTTAEESDLYAAQGVAARYEDRGLVGDAVSATTGFASGATLGGTDWLLGQVLTPYERERVQADIEQSPYVRGVSEVVGAVAPTLLSGGSSAGVSAGNIAARLAARTPTGYLSSLAARGVERGLARGGIGGTAAALGVMGTEGAAQSAGQYIGHAALADHEVTAEGLSGALGTGFAFGAVGGGAALGVTKGVMAGRRMFSRVMDGKKAADVAETSWSLARQEALDGDLANVTSAQAKLDTLETAEIAYLRQRNEAAAATRNAPEATPVVPDEAIGPQPLVDIPSKGPGGATAAYQKPNIEFDPAGAKAFDEGMPPVRDQMNEVAGKIEKPATGAKTGAYKAPEGQTARFAREASAPTELEAQLRGTKEQLDGGVPIKQIKEPEYPFGKITAQLKADLSGALSEYNVAKTDFDEMLAGFGPISDGIPTPRGKGGLSAAEDAAELLPPGMRPQAEPTAKQGPGNRKAIEILDDAHEEALLRARAAPTPQETGAALQQADQLEEMIEKLAGKGTISDGIPAEVAVVDRLEQASARLADALGDAAHPSTTARAKAYSQARDEASRKVSDRAIRALDDAEQIPQKTPKQRHGEAIDALAETRVQKKEAARDLRKAQERVSAGEKEKKAALKADAKAAKTPGTGRGSAAVESLGLLDIASAGLPGIGDLPVIGPLVSAYLRYRTAKGVLGRLMGKVPATADARVAALASRTRDRAARAVDRSLGLIERGGKYASRYMPSVAGILANRIYNDGDDDPGPKASVQKQAAARVRELSAYVLTPGAIEQDVRRELHGVTDPDLIAAAEKHRRSAMEWLLKHAPKLPEQGMMRTLDWMPGPGESMSFARRVSAVSDPAGVFERLGQARDLLAIESAEALRDVYPRLFNEARQRVVERIAEMKSPPPLSQRIQMSVFYQLPLEAALSPENLQITQSVYDRKPSSPAYNPSAPGAGAPPPPTAQPSVANPVNISEAYTPSFDRR